MAKALPTLSSEGWVTDIARKVDRALAYAFLTDGLQSNIYRTEITSIQTLIQENVNDEVMLVSRVRDALDRYFNRIFDSAQVRVRVEQFPNEMSSVLRLALAIEVTEDGEAHQVASMLQFIDGIFDRVVQVNDTGQERIA